MSEISIRRASSADAARIAALIERTVRISNAPDYDAAQVDAVCASFTPDNVRRHIAERDMFVAVEASAEPDGAIVGTVSLGTERLHALFVAPEWQGRGLGARLVEHLERQAAAKGMATLWVSSSVTARDFYARRGYREHELQQREQGPTYLMSLDLVS